MDLSIVIYRTEGGERPALAKSVRGGSLKVMVFDRGGYGLSVATLPSGEERYMRPVLDKKGRPYPLKRAVNHAKRLASRNRYGVTKAGRAFIKDAEKEVS